jgi:YegS/Rv2252/BmrU family lipid kinase
LYNFIVNPNARSGLGQKVWTQLEQVLKEKEIEYRVFFTEYQKHATSIVREITSGEEEQIVVALGGDGTVNEVVNGIVDYDKTILGYIPIGSSNDFARGLELPKNSLDALDVVLKMPNLHPMNVGEILYKGKKRRFAVSAGIGFDADIVHESVVSRFKAFLNKIGLGKLTYVGIAIHRLFLTTPCTVTVTLDGQEEIVYPKTYFVALMNNRYEGGGAMFAPEAKNDDDLLDVMVASNLPKLKVLFMFPSAFSGKHVRFKGVYLHRASSVKLQCDRPLPVHTDGEPIFLQNEMEARCAKKKVRVITTK